MSQPLFTVDSFLAYARSKDPNEKFNYASSKSCACSQYCASVGMDYTGNTMVRDKCGRSGIEMLAARASSEYHNDVGLTRWGDLVSFIEEKIAQRQEAPPARRLFHALCLDIGTS